MNISRRSLLITAPAVILTPHLLMPVKAEKIVTPRVFVAFPNVDSFFVEDGRTNVLPLSNGYQVGDVVTGWGSSKMWRCINARPPTTWEKCL